MSASQLKQLYLNKSRGSGTIRHCVEHECTKNGNIRCKKYDSGPGHSAPISEMVYEECPRPGRGGVLVGGCGNCGCGSGNIRYCVEMGPEKYGDPNYPNGYRRCAKYRDVPVGVRDDDYFYEPDVVDSSRAKRIGREKGLNPRAVQAGTYFKGEGRGYGGDVANKCNPWVLYLEIMRNLVCANLPPSKHKQCRFEITNWDLGDGENVTEYYHRLKNEGALPDFIARHIADSDHPEKCKEYLANYNWKALEARKSSYVRSKNPYGRYNEEVNF